LSFVKTAYIKAGTVIVGQEEHIVMALGVRLKVATKGDDCALILTKIKLFIIWE
jgi:hypothetical protein